MSDSDSMEVADVSSELLAEVCVYVGQELIAKYAMPHGEYIVGRDAACPIFVDADLVSRHHARLTFNAFELVLEDLGSSNGVFIDGVQVQLPTRVRLEQEVQIGLARLFIRLRDAAAQQLAAALWDQDLGLLAIREQMEGKKYKVITTINRGGMGVILQARDLRIRRTVAMKVMKTSSQFSRENVLRFIDEAQLTGQLEHPNIVPLYELGIDEHGEAFYSMKFVKGTTLDDVLRGIRHGKQRMIEKHPLGTLLTIFQKVCDGVAFAHSKGVVHRDLKPENIMIGSFGEVLVMDWGLAKNCIGGRREDRTETPTATNVLNAKFDDLRGFETMNGLIVGTPPYLSPEQARGELHAIDPRSDIYVLGCILYTILTLRPPVEGKDIGEVIEKIVHNRITAPAHFNLATKPTPRLVVEKEAPDTIRLAHCPGRRIPDGLSAVVMKAMQGDPAARYQSVEDLQAEVAAFQSGFAPKAERAGFGKQALLFTGRHKREATLAVACLFLLLLGAVTFIIQLTREKNRALTSERRALEQGALAAARLEELRGSAPTFAVEAEQLVEQQRLPEALEKIQYAIDQVPNEATYHLLRGHILQAQLRLDESSDAYEEALRLDPQGKEAEKNLALNKRILTAIGPQDQITPAVLAELYAGIVNQGRLKAAENLETQFGVDKQRLVRIWRDTLDKRGLRDQRFESNADGTINVDFSKLPQPSLRKLRDLPVSGLNLSDTKLTDLSGLRGLRLQNLSLARVLVHDLKPLAGMPLRALDLDSTPVSDLSPLQDLPLEDLRLNNTRVTNLSPLKGAKIEQLRLLGCRQLKDLAPLRGMPLQTLNLSRTAVTDLRPLTESPLRELNLEGCAALTDLHPLLAIATLESAIIPEQCKDIEYLRTHRALKRLSYKKITQTVEEFWKQYDTTKAVASPKPGA